MIVIKHFNRLWHPIPGNHYFAQNTVLSKVVISRHVGGAMVPEEVVVRGVARRGAANMRV